MQSIQVTHIESNGVTAFAPRYGFLSFSQPILILFLILFTAYIPKGLSLAANQFKLSRISSKVMNSSATHLELLRMQSGLLGTMDQPSGEYWHPRTAGMAQILLNILYAFKFWPCHFWHYFCTASSWYFWIWLRYPSFCAFCQGVQGFFCGLRTSFRCSGSIGCSVSNLHVLKMSTD